VLCIFIIVLFCLLLSSHTWLWYCDKCQVYVPFSFLVAAHNSTRQIWTTIVRPIITHI